MKLSKSILSVILVLVLIMGSIIPVIAVEPQSEPAGTPITSAEELAAIARIGEYYLANDILITGNWTAIAQFAGTLDGNGHTIVFDGAVAKGGIFNELEGATVKNLKITEGSAENVFIPPFLANTFSLGTVACYASGTIENVVSDVDIDVREYYKSAAGGIIGAMDGDLTVTNCINTGDVKASAYTGGIVGSGVTNGTPTLTVTRCVNYGSLSSSLTVGGVVGNMEIALTKVSVTESVNYGEIIHYSNGQGGGIIGDFESVNTAVDELHIINNVNYGLIKNEGQKNGISTGIVGKISALPKSSYVNGNINYAPLKKAVGQTSGSIGAINYFAVTETLNNYTVQFERIGAKDKAVTLIEGDNALTALRDAYPDVFAADNEGNAALAWTVAAGLGKAAPYISYNVTYSANKTPKGTAIENAAELAAINANGTYYLSEDIVISGTWTSPVGFAGVLDGNGHTITLDGAAVTGGIFNTVKGATIKNLTVLDVEGKNNTFGPTTIAINNKNRTFFGVLADTAYGVFDNIVVDVNVNVSYNFVGGIIGTQPQNAGSMHIIDCVNKGNITGVSAGGIISCTLGGIYNTSIIRCINEGAVKGSNTVGGIIASGLNGVGGLKIEYCINSGDVSKTIAKENAGGMIGFLKMGDNFGYLSIVHNINEGNISGVSGDGMIAGIAANIGTGNVEMDIAGNINYGEISGGANMAPIHVNGTSQRLCAKENNYSNNETTTGSVNSQGVVGIINDNTLGTLNAAYPGVYMPANDDNDKKITLAWTVMNTSEGASVRLKSVTGMRFTTSFDKAYIDALVNSGATVEFGTLIAPNAYVERAGAFTTAALEALGYEPSYLDVVANEAYKATENSYIYAGSVANIKEEHYKLDYAAIGYIKIGGEIYYSSSYSVRNVYNVAQSALADTSAVQTEKYAYTFGNVYSPYTEDERAMLNSFVV